MRREGWVRTVAVTLRRDVREVSLGEGGIEVRVFFRLAEALGSSRRSVRGTIKTPSGAGARLGAGEMRDETEPPEDGRTILFYSIPR